MPVVYITVFQINGDLVNNRVYPALTLTPEVLIQIIVTIDKKSVWKGLLGHFRRRINTPSASAFVQQRQKLLPSAFEALFHRFSDQLRLQKKFWANRLLAADGSSLKYGAYPADKNA